MTKEYKTVMVVVCVLVCACAHTMCRLEECCVPQELSTLWRQDLSLVLKSLSRLGWLEMSPRNLPASVSTPAVYTRAPVPPTKPFLA